MPHPVSLSRAVAVAAASALALSVPALGAAHARVQPAAASKSGLAQPAAKRPVVAPGAVAADGVITDLLSRDGVVYVRGYFDRVGRFVGSSLPLDPTTGARIAAPAVNGQVSVAVPDGSGGWFLGGDFSAVGGVTVGGLAHIDADGTPDPDFTPVVLGDVSALALQGTTLYVGGNFQEVDDKARINLAAVSTTTGQVKAFTSTRPSRVTELLLADGRLYAGGDQLVAIDPVTGVVDSGFSTGFPGTVRSLASDGTHLYVGARGLMDLDTDTGVENPAFDPSPVPFGQLGGQVHSLLLDGGRLYAGGSFGALGGEPGPLVALDPTDGSADPAFAPAIGGLPSGTSDKGVFDLAVVGPDLWAGGLFSSAGGHRVSNLVAVDPATGARRVRDLPSLNGQVNAVDGSDGGLRVGGAFYLADSVAARGTAALDAQTLLPVPGFRGHTIRWGDMVSGKRVIYVAPTHFRDYDEDLFDVDGTYFYPSKDNVRVFDPETGAAVERLEMMGVRNLTGITTIGNRLYVAQRLEDDERFPRNRVTVYSQGTGRKLDSFLLPLPGYVTELSSVGSDLLVAGSFRRTRPSGQPANLALLRLKASSGALRSAFDPQTNGPIHDVARSGGDLYASGYFDRAGYGAGRAVSGLARFDVQGSGLDLKGGFRAPRHYRSPDQRVTVLGDVVMLQGAGRPLFLDHLTGRPVADPVDGYRLETDFAAMARGSVVYVGRVYQPLGGSGYFPMSFVARGD